MHTHPLCYYSNNYLALKGHQMSLSWALQLPTECAERGRNARMCRKVAPSADSYMLAFRKRHVKIKDALKKDFDMSFLKDGLMKGHGFRKLSANAAQLFQKSRRTSPAKSSASPPRRFCGRTLHPAAPEEWRPPRFPPRVCRS